MSEFEAPISRIEAILQNILGADNTILPPFSRNEVLLIEIAGLINSITADKWKLIGSFEAESGYSETSLRFEPEAKFFSNPKYTKYKMTIEASAPVAFTGTGIPIRTYFQNSYNALGHRLIYTSSASVYRPSSTDTFKAEILITKIGTNAVKTEIAPSATAQCLGAPIIATANNGKFENGSTTDSLKYVYLDAMNTAGFTFEEGTKVNFYAWEED